MGPLSTQSVSTQSGNTGGNRRTDPEALPQTGDILPDAPDAPPERRYPIRIGIDIGRIHDPTAYAVGEVVWRATGRLRQISGRDAQDHPDPRLLRWTGGGWVELAAEPVYLVHQARRLELGLDYTEVAKRLADMICAPQLAGRRRAVWMDTTGVGAGIFAHLRSIIGDRPASRDVDLWPTVFTGGRGTLEHTPAGEVHVAKEWFGSRLGALLAPPARLLIARGIPDAQALQTELLNYSIRVRERDGHAEIGALRGNQWDDLVTAVGLLVLTEPDLGLGYIALHAPSW
jgi:hypothetical protein